MSYYDAPAWSAGARQPSWEQPPPPSRSGASSTVSRDDSQAFLAQLEEVDRAADNLLKSGKMQAMNAGPIGPGRRDSMPMMGGRSVGEFDPRMAGPARHSISEYDGSRSGSASNLQNFYANQRHHPRGGSEADQMMQAKRRMAAQRERELRNYHQEQQYNRSASTDVSGAAKSDRSMSPNTMSEEERRELIARQHRALYGEGSTLYSNESGSGRPISQDARVSGSISGPRNGSPLAYDPYGIQSSGQSGESTVQMPSRDPATKDSTSGAEPSRANSNSSPSSNPTAFGLFENAQQSSRTSNSSPGGSPPRAGGKATSGVAPIGTRPAQAQPQQGTGLGKRSTTPLPSPLSYGFVPGDAANAGANNANGNNANNGSSNGNNNASNNNSNNERSTSSSSNPSSSVADKGVGLGWGSNSGVWGTGKSTLGVQASVWG